MPCKYFTNFVEIVAEMSLPEILAGKRRIKHEAKVREEYEEQRLRSGMYLEKFVLLCIAYIRNTAN